MRLVLCVLALLVLCVAAEDFQLVFLQVVTRHGDRTPVEVLRADPAVWNCTQNVIAPGSQEGSAASVTPPTQLYRTLFIPNRQSLLGDCAKGQLTSIGHQQTNALGASLRQDYIQSQQFLSATYNASEIYVRSADSDRCMQSARNIIDGLYPPQANGATSLVVPIWLIEKSQDDMPVDLKTCPGAIEQVILSFVTHPEEVIKLVEPLLPHVLQLKKIFNTTHPMLAALNNYDNCNCRVHHDMPLPNGMSQRIFKDIQKSYWFGSQVLFNVSAPLLIEAFATELVGSMQQKMNGDLGPMKFQLFSGHDTTVGPLLSLMGLYDGVWPPYASQLRFSLLRSTSTGAYFVRVEYNGQVLSPPGCSQQPCPFEEFQTLMLPGTSLTCGIYIPHRGTVVDVLANALHEQLVPLVG